MDDFSRNNWIIIMVIISTIILISATMFGFITMLNNIGNNINLVVNNTSKNMTELTQVLIDQQKYGSMELNKVVDNQTQEFVKSVNNLTNVVINYSTQNDQNLNNVSNLILQSRIS
jgi:multisubunit Na+/H+ antiporter MnhC subunit